MMKRSFAASAAAAGFAIAAWAAAQERTVVQQAKHEVVHANTLWDLAARYYKDPYKWPVIHEANKGQINDPHWIYPGQVFVIPGLDTVVTVAAKTETAEPKAPEPKAAEPKAAEPVEASTPAEPSEPEPAAQEEPSEAAPVPEPQLQGLSESLPKGIPEAAHEALPQAETLSTDLPEGLVASQTSMARSRLPRAWAADGSVVEFRHRESMAGIGDPVHLRLRTALDLRKGQPLTVYRPAGPTEADQGQDGLPLDGTYVAKVGIVEVDRKLSALDYRAVVVRATGAVQVGDLLKIGEE